MSPSRDRWDVVVAGVGGMGSSALFHLARRGCRVLGVERFWVPNDRGSSHGRSRIIRPTTAAGPAHVPLARRAYRLWSELERISGERLLRVTGSIDAGPPEGGFVSATRELCRVHDIEHEVLGAEEVGRRFPGLRLPSEHQAVFQPEGGVLDPERCVETWVRFAESLGASLRTGTSLEGFEAEGDGVRVRLRDAAGEEEEHRCGVLILTVGAWTAKVLGLVGTSPLVPERQVMGWFRPFTRALFVPERFPAFEVEVEEGRYYGFPDFEDEGFQLGRFHHLGERVDPDRVRRTCSDRDRRVLRDFAERYVPEGAGDVERMETCLFTNTPDGHFVLDRLPGDDRVIVAGGFNGYGFQFASVVGEILADLALDGTTSHDVGPFALGRFQA